MTDALAHATLVVRDYDEAIAWFTTAMGFHLVEDTPLPAGRRWVLVAPSASPGASLLLARAETPDQAHAIGNQTGGRVTFFLHTNDFARAYDRMRAGGVVFLESPRAEPYGRVAVFSDLYGNRWDLIEPRRPVPARPTTRRHVHAEMFGAAPHAVFALLHTPSAVRAWWGAQCAVIVAETGGVWAATWGDAEDALDYVTVATIREFDPPRRLVLSDYRYWARTGPLPFDADFTTAFEVVPQPEGTLLRVTQDGFPAGSEADGFYAACQRGWQDTFAGIRRFLAGGDDRGATGATGA